MFCMGRLAPDPPGANEGLAPGGADANDGLALGGADANRPDQHFSSDKTLLQGHGGRVRRSEGSRLPGSVFQDFGNCCCWSPFQTQRVSTCHLCGFTDQDTRREGL